MHKSQTSASQVLYEGISFPFPALKLPLNILLDTVTVPHRHSLMGKKAKTAMKAATETCFISGNEGDNT